MTIIADDSGASWDYYDLKDALASWLHKSNVTAQIPDFISLAEDEMNAELRMREMEQTTSLTLAAAASTIDLPTRFLEQIKLEIVYGNGSDNRALTYVTPSEMTPNTSSGSACEPEVWTVDGDVIRFPNVANTAYTLSFRYYQRLSISDDITNDVLTNWRGLYLFGALNEASAWLVNDKRVSGWIAKFDRLMAKVRKAESRRKSKASLRTDAPTARNRSRILQG